MARDENDNPFVPMPGARPARPGAGLFRKRVAVYAYKHQGREPLVIHTLEGDMTAMPGDWVITGSRGETYPCKADIFEETYERVGS